MKTPETKMAKLLVEVQWGVIPGTVDGNRQWGFDRADIDAAESWRTLMAAAHDEFDRRLDPRATNWVTLTWLWL